MPENDSDAPTPATAPDSLDSFLLLEIRCGFCGAILGGVEQPEDGRALFDAHCKEKHG